MQLVTSPGWAVGPFSIGKPKHASGGLSKADLQLLKVAHNEELRHKLYEKKEFKKDEADLAAIRAKKAEKEAKKAAAAKAHPEPKALPAPFFVDKESDAKSAMSLGKKDLKALHIAQAEMKSETKKAMAAKHHDDAILRAREALKREAKKTASAAKARAVHHARTAKPHGNGKVKIFATPFALKLSAPPHASHLAKHQLHEMYHVTQKATLFPHLHKAETWGGYLPQVGKKVRRDVGHLGSRALQLLKRAQADQHREIQHGLQSKARDNEALHAREAKRHYRLSPEAHKEAMQEMREMDRESSIGLERATEEDNAAAAKAWH